MLLRLQKILSSYFNSCWMPAVVFFALFAIFITATFLKLRNLYIVSDFVVISLGIALLGILLATIWNLIKRRWLKGLLNLVMFVFWAIPCGFYFLFLISTCMLGQSKDGFADNLRIPEDIVLSEPKMEPVAESGGTEDAFLAEMLTAVKTPGNEDTSVTADIPALVRLQESNLEILRRYLITSPAWYVSKDGESIVATRRWMMGSEWRYPFGGYFSSFDISPVARDGIPLFSFHLTIRFSDKPWQQGSSHSTHIQPGETAKVTLYNEMNEIMSVLGSNQALSEDSRMYESYCVITAAHIIVGVFEESESKERRLTKSALNSLNQEFQPLAEHPTWKTIRDTVPSGSFRHRELSFELMGSSGDYASEIWVNPGEPGMIYLKAFEVTKGTSLSAGRLFKESNEFVGWSDDSDELFFSNTRFTIPEGDRGKPYAARFEVWFVPDSGATERKLIEKVFKIEGFER